MADELGRAAALNRLRSHALSIGPRGDERLLSDVELLAKELDRADEPVPMLLWCPGCGERHLDVGAFATKIHHTHACQACGMVWRPAIVPTVGVEFLPGFKNEPGPTDTTRRRRAGHSLTALLSTLGPDGYCLTADYAADKLGAPIESVRAALSKAVAAGRMERVKVGLYRIVRSVL